MLFAFLLTKHFKFVLYLQFHLKPVNWNMYIFNHWKHLETPISYLNLFWWILNIIQLYYFSGTALKIWYSNFPSGKTCENSFAASSCTFEQSKCVYQTIKDVIFKLAHPHNNRNTKLKKKKESVRCQFHKLKLLIIPIIKERADDYDVFPFAVCETVRDNFAVPSSSRNERTERNWNWDVPTARPHFATAEPLCGVRHAVFGSGRTAIWRNYFDTVGYFATGGGCIRGVSLDKERSACNVLLSFDTAI